MNSLRTTIGFCVLLATGFDVACVALVVDHPPESVGGWIFATWAGFALIGVTAFVIRQAIRDWNL